MSTTIKRQSLATQARALLGKRIILGELSPGERLNETVLAQDLGISRTPLRHALAGLEREGLVTALPDRGFFVATLNREEALEVYPILATVESFALRVNNLLEAPRLKRLAELNEMLSEVVDDPVRAVELNFAWHKTLIQPCRNVRLGELVQSLWDRVRRYEHAFYAPGRVRLDTSVGLHNEIQLMLSMGDLAEAAHVLERHWLTDLDQIVPEEDAYIERPGVGQ